jgi:hypothetical protein
MIHLPFPENPKLFGNHGHSEGTISSREAQRLLKRGIVEIVLDHAEIIGVIRIGGGLKAGEKVIEAPGRSGPAKFHRKQTLDGCWCWQLKDLEGRLVA